MRVALDTSPLETGHKVRGIGSYTAKLAHKLKTGKWGIQVEFFNNPSTPPPADVIHYPYFDLFFHTLPIRTNTSRVVTVHDVIPLVFPHYFPVGIKGSINLFLQKKALQKADIIICDSKTSKQDIVDKLSYPEDKIKVIYLAPGENFKVEKNIQNLNKVSKKFLLPKEFALYVGDVNWNKNLEGLLESIKIAGTDLVMVGASLTDSNIPQTQSLIKLIQKLNLVKKIHRPGFVSEQELVAIYNLASATVLPSYYEGFGLPVLESMACGTPVVCSKVASLAEIAGNAAIFCDPKDSKDISAKINQVINLSEKDRKTLSLKSVKHASSFSWYKVAEETVDVYKSLA